jgi:hypothetical protein
MPHQAVRARCRSEQLQFLDLGPDDENHLFWRPPAGNSPARAFVSSAPRPRLDPLWSRERCPCSAGSSRSATWPLAATILWSVAHLGSTRGGVL